MKDIFSFPAEHAYRCDECTRKRNLENERKICSTHKTSSVLLQVFAEKTGNTERPVITVVKGRYDPDPIQNVFLGEAIAQAGRPPHALPRANTDRRAGPDLYSLFCIRCCAYQPVEYCQDAAGTGMRVIVHLAGLQGPPAARPGIH